MSENRVRGALASGRRAVLKGLLGAALLLPDVTLPDGFTYDVVLKWGDVFTAEGRPFGYNNDFIGVFPLGGPVATAGQPFAQPDNLTFDSRGDLWMASDIAGDVVNDREDYRVFKNAGAFRVPTSGASRGGPGLFVSVGAPPQPAVVAIRRRT